MAQSQWSRRVDGLHNEGVGNCEILRWKMISLTKHEFLWKIYLLKTKLKITHLTVIKNEIVKMQNDKYWIICEGNFQLKEYF